MSFFKKTKKSRSPSHRLALGVPSHIGVVPLGIGAELEPEVGSEGINDGGGSRIVLRDIRDKRPISSGTPNPILAREGGVIPIHEREREQGVPANGRGTPDVSATERQPETRNRGEYERQGTVTVQPLEGPAERESEGDRFVESAHDIVPLERSGVAERTAGGVAIAVSGTTTPGFGPLKAILAAVYDASCKETIAVGNKAKILLSRVEALEKHFDSRPNDRGELNRRSDVIQKFKDIEGQLQFWSGESTAQQPIDRAQNLKESSELLERLRETIFDYQMKQQTAISDQERESMRTDEADVLNKIHCAKKAEYRHGDGNGCLKGTRGPVLDAIEVWARDPDKPPVYWLNGVAGTGKTTIARTIAARIFADGQLGASFFCSRDFEDRRDIHSIFPTLAVQLARKYAQFRSVFVRLVRSDPEIAHESLFSQMRKLILEPLKESRISTVIVVDALDECKDEEPASAILSVIGQFVSEIPKVKFLITGRPEPRIQEGFRLPLLTEATDVLILHEVDLSQVENDIRLFFAHEFSELARRRRGLDGWPTKEQLDLLCKRAAGLFIYAVATVKFVDKRSANPIERLNLLLRSPEDNGREARTKYNENTTLDSLYISVLKGAFGDDDDPDDDPKVRSVLGTMILAANPISSSSIAMLLGLDADRDVFPLLSSAQSLLILQDVNCPVRSFHKSFPDFITNPERCTSQRFYVSPPHHHSQLLISCLDLLSRTLEKNMCKLPDGVANSDVNDLKERIERCIGPALRYACTSWHTHLTGGRAITTNTLEITSALHGFLEDKFLFWLEVLSVLGAVGNAVDALQAAADWLEESPTLDLANDCFRFVIRHFEIINTSSPHIYHSALVLTPRESIIYRLYKPHAQPFVRVLHGIPVSWGPNTAATKSRFDIRAAVWSPCSRSIAISLWGTNRVDILDSATLQRLQSLEFPQKMSPCSQALAFSPDSRTLTSFIHDNSRLDPGFVISWDIQTGGVVSDIEWKEPHGAQAGNPQITYSMNGTVVAVLSRSESSTTISVYDIVSGVHMHDIDHRAGTNRDLPLGAPYAYKTWIHGESLRFVTPELTSITIWEVGFAPGATPMEVETISIPDENVAPFVSAQSDVTWVEFHPASCRLAFTDIDGTLLVWDVRASEFLLHHAGTGFDTFMTFSSDARFFACTTLELEVYLWKESPTGYMLLERLAPANQSSKPYLSPNGESILTSSDSMIRLWSTKGFTTSNGSTQALRHSENFLLEFIPNRQLAVITRREGKAVTVFDLESGILQLTINTSIKVYGLKVVENTIVVIGHKQVISWDLLGQSFLSGAVMNVEDSTQTIKFSNMDHYSIPVKSPLTNINHRRLGTKKSTPSDSG